MIACEKTLTDLMCILSYNVYAWGKKHLLAPLMVLSGVSKIKHRFQPLFKLFTIHIFENFQQFILKSPTLRSSSNPNETISRMIWYKLIVFCFFKIPKLIFQVLFYFYYFLNVTWQRNSILYNILYSLFAIIHSPHDFDR